MIPRRGPRKNVWKSYKPNSRQKVFHTVAAGGPTLVKGYIGAFGGGKSTAIEQEMIELMLKMPGGLSIATRMSMKRQTFALVEDFKRQLDGIADWNTRDECFTFHSNGHKLACLPADDWQRFGSVDICLFFIQEAHEVKSPKVFSTLYARLRNPRGYINGVPYYRGYIDARGITSSHWINKDFIELAWDVDQGPDARAKAPNPDYVYIRSRTEDNRENLRPGYIEDLRRAHPNDPTWEKVFLEGEVGYDVDGKPVFSDSWDRERHVAEIPEDTSLPILRGWDFGVRAPAVVWYQYTHSGRLLGLRELCPRHLSTDELIQQAHATQKATWPDRPGHTYRDFGDIAGEQEQSAASQTDIEKVEEFFGNAVESRKARVEDGLNCIRRLMRDGVKLGGKLVPRFALDVSCTTLIEGADGAYQYPEDEKGLDKGPIKGKGFDAPWDATRYIVQLIVEEGYIPMPSPYHANIGRGGGYYATYKR